MKRKALKKTTIKFIEENKEILKMISKYSPPPSNYMAATLLTEYNKERRRKSRY